MNKINTQSYKTKYAEFVMGSVNEKLCLLDFKYRKMRGAVDKRIKQGLQAEFVDRDDWVLQAARSQLDEYLAGNRKVFDLPLLLVGSDFQQSVWGALIQVPYGETSSYLQLSQRIGNVKAVRAVASANGANAIAIIVPCHRIIGSNGDLVGYGGGLPLKKRLLTLEQGAHPINITADLFD